VDIGGLAQLKGIKATPKGLRLGSGVTYRELLDSALVRKHASLIVEATNGIGDRQVRNRGTIGGSIAHADPASDLPAVLWHSAPRSPRGPSAARARFRRRSSSWARSPRRSRRAS
jgi:carbon-monoxide dehydrogenase medium subunit